MAVDREPDLDARRSIVTVLLIAAVLGILAWLVLRSEPESGFAPQTHDKKLVDLLGWLPANDASMQRYSAWHAEAGDPLGLTNAIDQLGVDPGPLALGRSIDWQQTTGIYASDVTGWASAPVFGATVLEGNFDLAHVIGTLDASEFERTSYRGVTIWLAPDGTARPITVAGDDLRAMGAIAIYGDRIVIGFDRAAVEGALDAAQGSAQSLADQSAVQRAVTEWTAGILVVDQRDIAIACGLGGPWLDSDFGGPSEAQVMITWARGSVPTTSVWVEYPDDLEASAGLTELEGQWRTGFFNQMGMGAEVSNLATTSVVYVDGRFVVADLIQGRDNGWTRSGVQYLIGICEHASRQIPATLPVRGTPVASPSPMEQP